MTAFMVLVPAYGKGPEDIFEVLGWSEMSEDEQVDYQNEYTQVLGMLCAGVYEAETPAQALQMAMDNHLEWEGGCVA